MYTYVHDKLSAPLFRIFSTNAVIHEYNTRQLLGPHVGKGWRVKSQKNIHSSRAQIVVKFASWTENKEFHQIIYKLPEKAPHNSILE